MRKLREDADTARMIDIALVMRKIGNFDDARNYLRAGHVAEEVIERVLSGQQARTSMTAAALALPETAGPPDPAARPLFYCATGRRKDVTSAAVVQVALALIGQSDAARAERLMRREALPEHVITRVLAGQDCRRRVR